jgi:hypothetical protein
MRVRERSRDAHRQHRIARSLRDDVTNRSLQRRSVDRIRIELLPHHRPRRQRPKLPAHITFVLPKPYDHESLRLVHLGERRSLDGARVQNRHVERAAREIRRQHLMPVDVPREDGGEIDRNLARANHVRGVGKREIAGTDRRPLDTVVNAQETLRLAFSTPLRFVEQCAEARPHIVPLVGKPR